MWTPLQRAPLVALVSLMLMASASADGGGIKQPSLGGPIFDITHFDVIPFDNFQQTAYTALFAYRDASRHDQGLESFRVVNWVLAPNHSQIIDVWDSQTRSTGTWLKITASISALPYRSSPLLRLRASIAASAARSMIASTVS
jgi:hypothetical protein